MGCCKKTNAPPGAKLKIDNIYSPEGRAALVQAYTKSLWAEQTFKRTTWMGAMACQTPEDLVILAELVWRLRPDLIVESGVHYGGTTLYYASLLELTGKGEVIGIDTQIGMSAPIMNLPVARRITRLGGSSTDPENVAKVRVKADAVQSVLVVLDSDHSKAHVLAELEVYAPMIRPGGYLVALDGIMQVLHDVPGADPKWQTDSPESAIAEWLPKHPEFERDYSMNKLGATFGPGGYLKRK